MEHDIVLTIMKDEIQPDSLVLELRRGIVVLGVLARLGREEYGYSLKRSLSESGLSIDEGTLYPLLRRLETQGLLESRWRVEGNRPRRYYQINSRGKEMLRSLVDEWRSLSRAIERLVS
jgi:PadR family transcriptional regulator PadR